MYGGDSGMATTSILIAESASAAPGTYLDSVPPELRQVFSDVLPNDTQAGVKNMLDALSIYSQIGHIANTQLSRLKQCTSFIGHA
jgi:hypothetical protein